MVKHTAEREEDTAVGRGREKRERKEKAVVPRGQLQMCRCGDARCARKQDLRPGSSFGGRAVLPFPDPLREKLCLGPGAGSACLLGCLLTSPEHISWGSQGVGRSPWLGGPSPQAPGPALGWWGGALLPKPSTQASPDCSLHPSTRLPPPLSRHSACAQHPVSPAHYGAL